MLKRDTKKKLHFHLKPFVASHPAQRHQLEARHPTNLTHTTAQRCRSATEKNSLEDLFSSVMSQFKKYHPLET